MADIKKIHVGTTDYSLRDDRLPAVTSADAGKVVTATATGYTLSAGSGGGTTVSGESEGDNWSAITIDGVRKNLTRKDQDVSPENVAYFGVETDMLFDSGVSFMDLRNPEYFTGAGTAAKTSSPYCYSKWVTTGTPTRRVSAVTNDITDGTTILFKVPVAGNATYGTCLSVDGGVNYHPVVSQTSTHVGTRYGVGAVVLLVYDAEQSVSVYGTKAGGNSATAASIVGCWRVVNDYVDGNSGDYNQRSYYNKFYPGNAIHRYQVLLQNDDTLVAVNTTSNSTSTTKSNFYTGEFDPLGKIFYYNSTTDIAASTTTKSTFNNVLYFQYLVDLRYSFNGVASGNTSKFYGKDGQMVYLVATLQDNGKAKLYYGANGTTYADCLTTELPTEEDGRVYIKLGRLYDAYRVQLLPRSDRALWFKDGAVRPYLGKELEAKLASAGGADWNQNDPTGAGYIQNRPFYEVITGDAEVIAVEHTTEISSKPIYYIGTTTVFGHLSTYQIPFTQASFDPSWITAVYYKGEKYTAPDLVVEEVLSQDQTSSAWIIKLMYKGSYRTMGYITFDDWDPDSEWFVRTTCAYHVECSWGDPYDYVILPYAGLTFIDQDWTDSYQRSIEFTYPPQSEVHTVDKKFMPTDWDPALTLQNVHFHGRDVCTFRNGIAIGDSIFGGNFRRDASSEFVRTDYSFPTQFEKLFGVPMYNAGIGGATTGSWYAAMQNAKEAPVYGSWYTDTFEWNMSGSASLSLAGFDFAVIQLGINDVLQSVPTDHSRLNINTIIDALKTASPGIKIFLSTLVPTHAHEGMETWHTYNEMIRDVAATTEDVYLLDLTLYSETAQHTAYHEGHMTAVGYRKLAEEVGNYISYIMYSNQDTHEFEQLQRTCGTDNIEPPVLYAVKRWVGDNSSGGGVPEITFTLAGKTYKARDGMSWAEWAISNYCYDVPTGSTIVTLRFPVAGSITGTTSGSKAPYTVSGSISGGRLECNGSLSNSMSEYIVDSDWIPVDMRARIVNGGAYYFD